MPLLTAKDLNKAYGDKTILGGADLNLIHGEKVGLLGVNGSGKSTILKMLAGEDTPDGGEMAWRNGIMRTWLPQNPPLDPNMTLRDVAIAGAGRNRVGLEVFERELRAERMLTELHVADMDMPVSQASGGTRRRAALAGALLEEPDLLLLDEPTNHLDVESIEWLEGWLKRFSGAVVLISHDRYFLEQVVDRILEVRVGRLWSYPGSFSAYLQARLAQEQLEARVEHNRKRRLSSELEWLRRSPKARSTKQKARIQRAEGLMESNYEAPKTVDFGVQQGRRLGKTILEARGLSVGYPATETDPLFHVADGIDLTLTRGWRLGLIGANGAGKTTLLRTLIGELTPLAGKLERGKNTEVLYIDQERTGLDPNATVSESATPAGSDWVDVMRMKGRELVTDKVHVATWLERFLFRGDDLRQKVSTLSGGQRFRLLLAKALQRPMNLFALDEPTNDLDLETLSVLEEALIAYPGCMVVVSHDRAFLDRVCSHVLYLPGDGTWDLHNGGWSQWQAKMLAERKLQRDAEAKKQAENRPAAPKSKGAAPPKLTWAEEKRLDKIEAEIEAAEAAVEAAEAQMVAPDVLADHTKMRLAGDTLQSCNDARDEVYAAWETLSEKQELWLEFKQGKA
ncbi:MAG: ABC-F family ATP-binding cassette domain-containing protein [Myxococcales bacterium]|nr:ABC-F family ATP-binding cassette domain-containing protein [Myxococcales bacterium]